MDYSIALENGMNPSTPLNGCEINVRFCFAQCIKAVMSKICFSSLDVSECSYREFLQCTIKNALLEFLFVMLNQSLDFSFFESFIYNTN